jgi:hypothetical protein
MKNMIRTIILFCLLIQSSGSMLGQNDEDSFLPQNLQQITTENIDQLTVLGRLGLGRLNNLY